VLGLTIRKGEKTKTEGISCKTEEKKKWATAGDLSGKESVAKTIEAEDEDTDSEFSLSIDEEGLGFEREGRLPEQKKPDVV